MPDRNLINEKLKAISTYLSELKPLLELSFKDFNKDYRAIRTAERDFQLIVDCAVDINTHIILEKGVSPPETNFQSFILLGGLGVVSEELTKNLAPSAGLRNRLVHEYEKIDPHIFYNSIKKFLPLYGRYSQEIYDFK